MKDMSMNNIAERIYDPSCVSEYMKCPTMFYHKYVLGLVPKEDAPALTFGSLFHEAMDILYGEGGLESNLEEAVQVMYKMPEEGGDQKRSGARGEAIVRAYVERYKGEGAFKTVAKEVDFKFPLTRPAGATIAGRMDRVVEWDGQLWAWDFKTTSSISGHFLDSFRPSLQMDVYCWAVREMMGSCAGAIIDGVLVSKANTNFARPFTDRTGRELDRVPKVFGDWVEEIEDAIQKKNFRMSTALCHSFWFRACDYAPACIHGEKLLELKYKKRERDGTSNQGAS